MSEQGTAEEFNANFAKWTGVDFMALAKQAIYEVVSDGMECERCGEARADWLICGADDTVKCATCGMVYKLEAAEEG